MNLTNEDIGNLQKAVEATNNGGMVYATTVAMANLITLGLVEANPNFVDGNGGFAHRATPAGIEHLKSLVNAPAAPVAVPAFLANVVPPAAAAPAPVMAAPAAAPVVAPAPPVVPAVPAAVAAAGQPTGQSDNTGNTRFQIGTGFALPQKTIRRSGGTGKIYPFESLELNGFIFVPATEERQNPKKSLASTVSAANRRFADFNPPRYFRTFRASKGQVFGTVTAPADGVYIVRVEPPAPASDAPAAPAV